MAAKRQTKTGSKPRSPKAQVETRPIEAESDGEEREERDDDDATEVVAEVVPDIVDEADEAEPAEVDEDDEERPRRKSASVVPYAEDESSKDAALSRYDPMQAYLREVQRHPLLTPEQEHDLATKWAGQGDVAAAHKLVTSNLRLVVKIAYEYRRAYKNIMDLVQEGNVGLMQAVKKYDPTRGVKLSSYAAWWIRAYILRYILNNWRMVKLGTTQAQRKLFFNLNKEKQKLLAMGIDPTAKVIAERLHVDEKEVSDMDVRLGSSEASLDAPVGDTDGKLTPRVDLMAGSGEAADVMLAEAELTSKLKDKLASFRTTLKGKDLEIFDMRLVAQDEPLTLQELGDRFGVSRERVRQLEARLVGKLRQHLRDELDEAAR
ncbi:MAG: sigma-70 family RNA polymerase sigma factor [Polyangiales bacterium]